MLSGTDRLVRQLWDNGKSIEDICSCVHLTRSVVITKLMDIFGYTLEYLKNEN